MKLQNAIKKLSKHGKVEQNGSLYFAKVNGHIIDFICQSHDSDIHCLRLRGERDEDDVMTDYFGGVWCDSMRQALRIAGAAA